MRAKEPFKFHTSSQLVEITGRKAANLKEFLEIIKEINDSSIFYHVHHAFREHQFAPGHYTNDFAHWIGEELSENALAERLANINIKDYLEIQSLRQKIAEIIENHLKANPGNSNLTAKHKFYFCKNIGVVQKTKYIAWELEEFCDMLNRVGLRSLFFHFFEARLRLGRKTNDFSDWIIHNFHNAALARQIEALDPYLYTMDQLRDQIISLICGKKEDFFGRLLKWLKAR
ncbi:MAG: DUF5752 family protein [Candidatus Margulisbacteria bacterium]|nr:DUF5752 family protein [Candidatus Margulisiibacteriota bacterium]